VAVVALLSVALTKLDGPRLDAELPQRELVIGAKLDDGA